jgi:hypothetical protein
MKLYAVDIIANIPTHTRISAVSALTCPIHPEFTSRIKLAPIKNTHKAALFFVVIEISPVIRSFNVF